MLSLQAPQSVSEFANRNRDSVPLESCAQIVPNLRPEVTPSDDAGSAAQACVNRAAFRIEIEKYEKCGGPVLIVVVRFKK